MLIAEHVEKHTWFDGEIELDESYFGGRRKGVRGSKVYTKVIPDAKSRTLLPDN